MINMKSLLGNINERISKLENVVLILFGATFIAWLSSLRLEGLSILVTVLLTALLITSLALFVSVLRALMKKKKAAKKTKPRAKKRRR